MCYVGRVHVVNICLCSTGRNFIQICNWWRWRLSESWLGSEDGSIRRVSWQLVLMGSAVRARNSLTDRVCVISKIVTNI